MPANHLSPCIHAAGKENLQHYGKWSCNTMEKLLATFSKKYLQKTAYGFDG